MSVFVICMIGNQKFISSLLVSHFRDPHFSPLLFGVAFLSFEFFNTPTEYFKHNLKLSLPKTNYDK